MKEKYDLGIPLGAERKMLQMRRPLNEMDDDRELMDTLRDDVTPLPSS